jgi:hypothetical protein
MSTLSSLVTTTVEAPRRIQGFTVAFRPPALRWTWFLTAAVESDGGAK